MKKSALICILVAGGLMLAVALSDESNVVLALQSDIPSEDCLDCHSDPDEVGEENVIEAAFDTGPHVADNDVSCASCHPGAAEHMEDPGPMEPASCVECHDDVIEDYERGAHSTRLFKDNRPTCVSCHGPAHQITYSAEDPASPAHKLNQPKTCGACHSGQILDDFMKSVHGRLLTAGEEMGPACSNCHSAHDIRSADLQRNPEFKRDLLFVCSKCHEAEFDIWKESIHGVAFLEQGVYESASCASCHSSHQILSPSDPESTVYTTKIIQDCENCHSDTKLIRRFGLPSDVVGTYENSYHGRAIGRGDTQVANCASCHHYHDIFAMDDPRSSINPEHLAETCGSCHPGAGPNFIAGKIHVRMTEEENYWSWLVANLYIGLIVMVIGGMVVHNIFDFVRKLIIRNRQHKSEPHVIRMTLLERILHGTLATSFLLLVYTGFALVWPQAWWGAPFNWFPNPEAVRSTLHRICGVMLIVVAIHHLWFLFLHPRGREQRKAFMPGLRDFRDLRHNIMFYLGFRTERPHFGRFTYMEKAEYWALVWGTAVMMVTGLILWFQDIALMFMPLWLWEVCRVVHFYEAVLAFLAIIVWHFYFVMFNPDESPLSLTFLSGRMTHKELAKVHPEEFEEIKEAERRERESGN